MTARTLPTMPTWTAGQEITSSQLNQITTYAQFWANPPMFRMYQSVSTNVPTAAGTQVPMDVSQWDTDSGRSAASPYNYVVPFAGRWRFTAMVVYGSNTTGGRQTLIYQNGALAQGFAPGVSAGSNPAGALAVVTLYCNVGDTIGVWAWQNSGSTLGTDVGTNECSYFEGVLESLANP